jgi:His/Glu/Gln/Arg/opine family amino acid ABC transporter permease subunit
MDILPNELTAILTQLASGLLVSVGIFISTLLFSLPLGLLFSFGRMSKNAVVRLITKFYISVMRGTPLMLQLMVIYFGPWYIFRIPLSHVYRYYAVIIGFVLNYAAYFAEIYRGGIESIGAGQYEAAKVLGFSNKQTFFRIILPQVVKRIMPSVTNEVITLVKDTSLAMVISVSEMFTAAQSLASAQVSIIPFVAAGIFYYIMNYAVAWSMELFEKRLSYYR